MSDPSEPSRLIAGQYSVEIDRPLAEAGGGLPAFVALDRRSGAGHLMAVSVRPLGPPRAAAIAVLQANPVDGVLSPVAHGVAPAASDRAGYFIISPAPPGPPLSARSRPWSEAELLDHVLRPAAKALGGLQARGVTHRAIRPCNLFQAAPGQPVALGAAWAAPPACLQPALYEPPYVAMCAPAGRSEGAVADDIYALGVVLLTLALGRPPLPGLDDSAIIERKLALGGFAALAGTERLHPMLADLIRSMLAEEPEHRPTPAALSDPATARERRVATRPARQAPQGLRVGGIECRDARTLAYAIARHPGEGLRVLKTGLLDHWLRRSLGDRVIAAQLEEAVRQRDQAARMPPEQADAVLMSRFVAVLDPLAPLCFEGMAVWPDGLGPAIAAAEADNEAGDKLTRILADEMLIPWAAARPERCDVGKIRHEARQHRQMLQLHGPAGFLERLSYSLNPLPRCASPLLDRHWVARIADLPPALESLAGTVDRKSILPMDRAILAFVAAKSDLAKVGDTRLSVLPTHAGAVAQLRILARLQARFHPEPLPGLCAWMAAHAELLGAPIHGRTRRTGFGEELRAAAATGRLEAMLALVEALSRGDGDEREADEARAALARIDAELDRIAAAGGSRLERARCLGQEMAVGAGIAALAGVLLLTAWG